MSLVARHVARGPADAMTTTPDPLEAQRCAAKLAALAAPDRLRVVHYLRDGERNAGEIAAMLRTQAVNVTHHMSVLVAAGLVRREKRGRHVYFSLLPDVLPVNDGCAADGGPLDLGCCKLTW